MLEHFRVMVIGFVECKKENVMQSELYGINEAAMQLGVSVDVIKRFIRMGLVFPVNKQGMKLTRYGIRRLKTVLDLYEKSYPMEHIEAYLNH